MPESRKTIDPLQVVEQYRLAVEEAVQSNLNEIKNRLFAPAENPAPIDSNIGLLQQRLYGALQEIGATLPRSAQASALQAATVLWAMQEVVTQSSTLLRSLQIWGVEIPMVFRTDLRIVLKKIAAQVKEEAAADPSAARQEIGQQIDRLRQKIFTGNLPDAHKMQLDAMFALFDEFAQTLYGLRFWCGFVGSARSTKPLGKDKGIQ